MRVIKWLLGILFGTENKLDWCNHGEGRVLRPHRGVRAKTSYRARKYAKKHGYREVRAGEAVVPGSFIVLDLESGKSYVKDNSFWWW